MTIGILGGGQLGRMLALSAYRLGERVVMLDPNPESCGGHVAPLVVGRWDDPGALAELARRADVVTFEFENVPESAARFLADRVTVAPPPRALVIAQDRALEKAFFVEQGMEVAPYAAVDSFEALQTAIERIGLPAVLKTRRFGYDGKGQHVLRTPQDVEAGWLALGAAPLLVEAMVPFDFEVSAIACRGRDGQVARYPLVENQHRDGVLRLSRPGSPRVTPALQAAADAAVDRALAALDYVGILTIEFFVCGGRLLANEMAPRVHNSGHYSVDGAVCSQFDNHVRALLGLPLGDTALRGPCAMVNVVGAMPPMHALTALPGVYPHAYGKRSSRGRKIGHITVLADDAAALEQRLAAVQALVDEVADG